MAEKKASALRGEAPRRTVPADQAENAAENVATTATKAAQRARPEVRHVLAFFARAGFDPPTCCGLGVGRRFRTCLSKSKPAGPTNVLPPHPVPNFGCDALKATNPSFGLRAWQPPPDTSEYSILHLSSNSGFLSSFQSLNPFSSGPSASGRRAQETRLRNCLFPEMRPARAQPNQFCPRSSVDHLKGSMTFQARRLATTLLSTRIATKS